MEKLTNIDLTEEIQEIQKRAKMDFAKLANSTPLSLIKDSMSTKSRYSIRADRVKTALETRDVAELRKISQYFYYTSGEYRRLVNYAAQLLTFDYVVVPRVEPNIMEKKSFHKALNNILNYVQNSGIEETGYQIGLAVVRDGIFFGYETVLGNEQITMQPLPTDYCRTRYKINGIYQIEFDNKYFDNYRTAESLAEAFQGYPEEFERNYKEFKAKGESHRWSALDPQYARAHLLEDAIPMFSAVFNDILELDEYKSIDKTKLQLSVYTLLVQKIPLNKDNELALYMEEITDLHNNARRMIKNPAIDVLTTPCEMDSVTLDSGANSRVERDNIDTATNMIYNSAGTPIALFNAGSSSGSIGLNLSVKVDESLMFPLLTQFERWYRNKFAELSPSLEFGIIFPPITIFNRHEKVAEYHNAASFGFPTKLLAMAAMGIRQYDAGYLLEYENSLLDLPNRMIPLSSSHTSSGTPGRPESEGPLTPEGEKTRDKEKNDGRAKEE